MVTSHSEVPLLNFEGGPRVPLLNFRGSQGPAPSFTPWPFFKWMYQHNILILF